MSEPDRAATPMSTLLPAPTFGLGTIDQEDPFQCSTTVFETDTPSDGFLIASPTAHTSEVETIATPRSVLMAFGLGLGTVVHAVPFQRVASVRPPAAPTAHMS